MLDCMSRIVYKSSSAEYTVCEQDPFGLVDTY